VQEEVILHDLGHEAAQGDARRCNEVHDLGASHESPRTTTLYDRTKERLTQDEIERIKL
jgi:hypothetical protein